MKRHELPVVMTIAEVMDETGLARGTVRKAIEERRLLAKKVGRRILIRRVDFEAFIEPDYPAKSAARHP